MTGGLVFELWRGGVIKGLKRECRPGGWVVGCVWWGLGEWGWWGVGMEWGFRV